MHVEQDDNGNEYVEVGNLRFTRAASTWGGERGPGLRIQAKKGSGAELHWGPEIPVEGDDEVKQEVLAAVAWALYG